MTGRIFDIKEFSVHDGPGARITLFLKGCSLRCPWCHNPEGQSAEKELMVRTALCAGCGLCRNKAENEAFRRYGRNPSACPKGLITESGTDMTPGEILDRVLPFKEMMMLSEGGVTFSGGEPLLYPEFLWECTDLLHQNGIHVALETCGYAPADVFRNTVSRFDHIMMDLKIFDPKKHLETTGVSNAIILENARFLMEYGTSFVFRTPLIPGYTDEGENLERIKKFVGASPWECLPYNELAGAKYPMLNRIYPLDERKGE